MTDDNNNRGRGPHKGGGAGGRGGGKGFGGKGPGGRGPGKDFGGRGEGRGAPRDGERKPFRGHSAGEERPARRFERPASAEGEATRPRRAAGERPARFKPEGEGRGAPRDGERRPFRSHSAGEERPARRFERPAGAEGEAPRPRRTAGERPARFKSEGEARGGFGRPPRSGSGRDGEKRFSRPRPPRTEGGGGYEDRPRHPRDAAPERKLITAQEPERIAKVMARAGIASRRDCEAMIEEGRVSVNGTVLESPALDVGPNDVVLVDGEPLPARERTRLWLYHKPRGVVTTNFDPEGRPTVFDALPEDLPRVLTIGRLDINTEGLLLLTNDGGLARVLELPETGWLRRYRVRAFGEVTQDVLDTVKDGVTIDGIHYGPVTARFERQQGFNTWLTVDLREGKNREVKTVLEHLGLTVNRLIRISFGPFQLGDLPEGEADEVRSRVLQDQLGSELAGKAGADFEAPRRDALPAAPRPAPAADDRPRRRRAEPAEDEHESRREAVRELRGDKPWTRTVWRDSETEPQRERKAAPRRGADPKLERQSREESGTVKRQRGNAIADPKGRRVLVERVSAAPREEAEAPRESKRRPDRKPRHERGGNETRAPRSFDRPSGGERPARRPREEAGGRDRGDDRPWQDRAPRGERPERAPRGERSERAPRDGAERPARRFSERPDRAPRDGAERPARRFGERPGGDGSRGRSFGGRSEGGERPSGGRPFGGKPGGGGRPGGGRPGGGKGPRPPGKGPRPGGDRRG